MDRSAFMSRGPGRWQRSIVGALADRPAVWLRDLLPRQYSASEYQALYRAARRLSNRGTIALWSGGFSHSRLVLAKPGYQVKFTEVPRLSVEPVPSKDHLNT
jgi:hypothetical protein